ncbi:alkane 1-monooxygenase [Roseovarius autotrophicus]|uniref:alkane 1-monooxygenase n=1 Tax=Roseovarius autotrophicus TaxID=2824121 RepID=UPI001B36DDBF|nr:alkane 1-monooxygenase [Roseovarius autotrophicus]
MHLFAFATIPPLALTALAALFGGVWGWLAVGYATALVFCLDRLIARAVANPDPETEFPAADTLLVALGLGYFVVLALALRGVSGAGGLAGGERVMLAIAVGLVAGQIAHPVAHELIHCGARGKRWLGRLIYTSLLFGHHASAHLHVHHALVATPADPSSAHPGEGFYRYMLRAWPGAYLAGLRAETRRHGRAFWRHPYALYMGGAAAMVAGVAVLWDWRGIGALGLIAGHAQIQILLADYVQHYGLHRARRADGRFVPVGPAHSWNAPHWYSSAMTLNAPRHSDHHVTPRRPYPALQLVPAAMPVLPHSLPVMAVLALVPPVWRRVMDGRAARWRESSGGGARDLAG